jgi:catechol 2,3-dioxygenase-like lactoylglutathione lyase family enzyme
MAVAGIDHVNIRTINPEASARFYEQVLGFVYRHGPVVMGTQSHWLFDSQENAIIHFRNLAPSATDSGAIDHVALRCTDRAGMRARLDEHAIQYAESDKLTPGLAQIFIRDPHGVTLELNFIEPEASF